MHTQRRRELESNNDNQRAFRMLKSQSQRLDFLLIDYRADRSGLNLRSVSFPLRLIKLQLRILTWGLSKAH